MFLPATAPSGVGINEYYKSDEEYFHALAAELSKEYRAIADAGILVQIDDPFLPDIFFEPGLDDAQMKRRAEIYVEATNAALEGIPAEKVRFHTCYGINEGPRLYEAALADIIEYVLKINAGSYSFEAANPRHEHEYHLFERVKVPDGKVLVPRRDHACQQHRRASRADRRAHRALRQAGRPRERHGRRRLRLLLAGALPHRGASDRGVGEIQGDAPGRRPGDEAAMEVIRHSGAERSEEPESIIPALVVMDSGLAPSAAPKCHAVYARARYAAVSFCILPAHAEDAASFYRGKQIRFIVGSAPGGTYDLFARAVARHMGAHIPGNPSIIVQNQPTAGGMVMTNQLYALGPKDGTAIGVPINGIPAAPLLAAERRALRRRQADLARQHHTANPMWPTSGTPRRCRASPSS